MHRRLTAIVLQILILVSLVGVAGVWAATGKTVTVVVDGSTTQVRNTHAGTVGGALDRAGIKVGPHDVVAPDRDARLDNGTRVVLQRGRLIKLTFEGRQRSIWVTARSVDELLSQVGLRHAKLYVSASRSHRIPLKGMSLELRLPKATTVLVDGRAAALTTTVSTVGELLDLNSIKLGKTDRISQPLDALLNDGMVVTVTRLRNTTATVTVRLAPPVIRKPDASLFKNQSKVLDPGAPGIAIQTWTYTITNGKVTARKLIKSVTTKAPRAQILAVGTKPVPKPTADGLNWAALADCESGGNPRAVNPAGYYGLYQFSLSTWRSVGGSGNPIDASPDEQTLRAQILYNRSGAGQWPNCGRYLFT